jgi:DNA repair exonuclease SbcCD ATPase subunit
MFSDVDLDFTQLALNSVVYVEGINHDATDSKSNWSGKSTLLIDAFKWIIRGKYDRLEKANDVVGSFDKWTSARLVYIVDGNRLIITRYRKHPKYKNSLTVKWRGGDITGERIVESMSMFEKLTKMDVARFTYGVLFDSNNEFDLFKQKPAARNKVLGAMWELEEFNDAVKVCSEMCSGIDKRLMDINHRITALTSMISEINESIKLLEDHSKNFNKERNDSLEKLKKKITDVKAIIDNKHKLHEELIFHKEERIKLKDTIVELNRRLVESNQLLDKWNSKKALIASHREVIRNNEMESSRLLRDIAAFMKDTKKGVMCESCGNVVTSSGKIRLVATKKEIIARLSKRNSEIETEILKIKTTIRKIIASLKMHNVETVTNSLSSISQSIAVTDEKISSLSVLINVAEGMNKKLNEYRAQRDSIKEQSNPYIKQLVGKSKIRDEYTLELRQLQSKKKELEQTFIIYKFWSGSKGFKMLRNLILTERVGLMSDAFSTYVDSLTEGSITGEWFIDQANGNIDCELYDAIAGKRKHFDGFSKAQRSKISIAQDLATALLCAPDVGEIHFDEVLDDGIDDVGFYKILEFLKNIQGFNKIIFITSHRDGVSNISDAVLRIERRNNLATATLLL